MIQRFATFVAAAAMLAACASAPSTPPVPDAPDAAIPSSANDTCGASMYAELIGKPIEGKGVPGEGRLNRHIRPGTQVTMDYLAQRMNIEADGAGTIRKINCG